jgi:DNA modification methylase
LPNGHPDKSKEIGLEYTPVAYVSRLVEVFREVRRVLKPDGLAFVNLGDSYASGEVGRHDARSERAKEFGCVQMDGPRMSAKLQTGIPPKNLLMVPARVAIALQEDGWCLRSEIVWAKKSPMPESVTDRFTRAHEMVYMLAKHPRYYFNQEAIAEPAAQPERNHDFSRPSRSARAFGNPSGSELHSDRLSSYNKRNPRSVFHLGPEPLNECHFAVMPTALVKPFILAGSRPGDTVLDPFAGSGTTLMVALEYGRKGIGIELSPDYCHLIEQRCNVTPGLGL